jgi:AraC-like DNA-binding protein
MRTKCCFSEIPGIQKLSSEPLSPDSDAEPAVREVTRGAKREVWMDKQHLVLRILQVRPGEPRTLQSEGLLFLLPQQGLGACACGRLAQNLEPGDVVVVNHSAGVTLSVSDGQDMELGWFSARLDHLYPLLGSSEILLLHSLAENLRGMKRYPVGSPASEASHQLLEGLISGPDSGRRLEWVSRNPLFDRSRMLGIVAAVLSLEFDRVQKVRSAMVPSDSHFSKILDALSLDDFQALSVGELAARFGCSRRHLNRLFQRHLGVSVAALRMEARLIKAVSLLRHPDTKIISIAESCGFNHLGLFNTCFKRRFGVTPGVWRKGMLGSSASGVEPSPAPEPNGSEETQTAGNSARPSALGPRAFEQAKPCVVEWLNHKAAELAAWAAENPHPRARVARNP